MCECSSVCSSLCATRVCGAGRVPPVGDRAHVQAAGHAHDGFHQHTVVFAGRQLADEGTVDLDHVHRPLVQAGQRGVASAEVVQRQRHNQADAGIQWQTSTFKRPALCSAVRRERHTVAGWLHQLLAVT